MNDLNSTITDGNTDSRGHSDEPLPAQLSVPTPSGLPIRGGGCGKCSNCTCDSDAGANTGNALSPADVVTSVAVDDR